MTVSTIIKSASSKDFIKLQEAANKALSEKVIKLMEEKKIEIAENYFGQVDEFGHGAIDSRASFSPDSALYLHSIGLVDSHIGEVLRAMRARPQFAQEDWLVLITTDHGGRGNSHGGDSDQERNIWLLAEGKHLDKQQLTTQPVPQTALVPLIYTHLGMTPKPEWNPPPKSAESAAK
jgi:predicted AlkP superfamily pyrophosphatase or phosphodiesterase